MSNIGGMFENLQQLVAAGFMPSDDNADEFAKDYAEGGLFFYTPEEKAAILRTNFSGKLGKRKNFDMVAYLMELGYDLAIDRDESRI